MAVPAVEPGGTLRPTAAFVGDRPDDAVALNKLPPLSVVLRGATIVLPPQKL